MSTEPLKVYYSGGGQKYLLHWWTYNERGHIILASSQESLLATAKRIFQKYPDAEIRDYLRVEIVAPSNRLSEVAAAYEYQQAVSTFEIDLVCSLKELIESGKKLPEPFKDCEKYDLKDKDNRQKPDRWMYENHYDCQNCRDRIVFPYPIKEMYDLYGKLWQAINPSERRKPKDERVLSRARLPNNNEKLWIVRGVFGHHLGGIEIEELQLEDSEEELSNGYCGYRSNIIFCFLKNQIVDLTKVNRNNKLLNFLAEIQK